MAQQARVIITDDLDGTEGARTYRFAWGETVYEVDLTDAHRDELLHVLEPYTSAGRRVRPGRARIAAAPAERLDRATSRAIREWAAGQGIAVKDRGRIPASVVEAYRAAGR